MYEFANIGGEMSVIESEHLFEKPFPFDMDLKEKLEGGKHILFCWGVSKSDDYGSIRFGEVFGRFQFNISYGRYGLKDYDLK